MKKLTSLQILTLMSLSLGSSYTAYSKADQSMDDMMSEAVELELQAADDENAKLAVLNDLAQSNPMAIGKIIEDEKNLDANFKSQSALLDKINGDIEKFNKEKSASEIDIAMRAIEVADIQENFEKATARQRILHKNKHKSEQIIKNSLMKAEQGLKLLSEKSEQYAEQVKKAFNKGNPFNKDNHKRKKSRASKALVKASSHENKELEYQAANEARHMPGVQDQVAENYAAKHNMSKEDANAMIEQAFNGDQMSGQASDMSHDLYDETMNNEPMSMNAQDDNQAMMEDTMSNDSSDEVAVQSYLYP